MDSASCAKQQKAKRKVSKPVVVKLHLIKLQHHIRRSRCLAGASHGRC